MKTATRFFAEFKPTTKSQERFCRFCNKVKHVFDMCMLKEIPNICMKCRNKQLKEVVNGN